MHADHLVTAKQLGAAVAHKPAEEPALAGDDAKHRQVRGVQHGLERGSASAARRAAPVLEVARYGTGCAVPAAGRSRPSRWGAEAGVLATTPCQKPRSSGAAALQLGRR